MKKSVFYIFTFKEVCYLSDFWSTWYDEYLQFVKGETDFRKYVLLDEIVIQDLKDNVKS